MKKLILSIVSIAIAIVALGTSTFAWFSLSNKTTVGQFNAEVTGGDGLEISLDNLSWYSTIPSTVMQEYLVSVYGYALSGDKPIIKDITSFDGKSFEGFEGSVASGWIEFEILFRSRVKTEVYWTYAQLGAEAYDWIADNKFIKADGIEALPGQTLSVNPANSIRVSIEGFIDSLTPGELDPTSTVYAYEKADGVDGNTYLGTTAIANGGVSYYKAKTGADSITTLPTNLFPTFTDFSSTLTDNNKIVKLVENTSTSYNEGKVTVRVWMEGWDADTYNAILGLPVNVALGFQTQQN